MTIDGDDDLDGLRRCGAVVAEARDAMLAAVEVGVSTAELDAVGRDVLRRHGARSAPRVAYRFPGTTCISVNDEAAHGVPSHRRLCDGDLVNIDVSAVLDGYWTDTGASAPVGRVSALHARLLTATLGAHHDALAQVRAGRRVSAVGRAVERRARREGFSVVEELCGHGVGRFIHEEPSIPSVEDRSDRTLFREGLVVAIEPFLSTAPTEIFTDRDGWTLRTVDGSRTAQFEHTVVVTHGDPIVLTASAA